MPWIYVKNHPRILLMALAWIGAIDASVQTKAVVVSGAANRLAAHYH